MAYQVGTDCYPDMPSALDAFAAQETGKIINSGDNVFNVTASRSGDTSITFTGTRIAGTASNWSYSQAMTFPSCQKLSALDGATVGWLLFAVFLAVYAVKMMRRAL
jgi:hypothetical protein